MKRILCISTLLWAVLPMCRTASGQNDRNASWYVSGRVVLEDGSPPADRVEIVATCNGQSYVAARTDKMGIFSFRPGSGSRAFQDASAWSNDGSVGRLASIMGPTPTSGATSTATTDSGQQSTAAGPSVPNDGTNGTVTRLGAIEKTFTNCDMQARLPGYKSASVSLTNRGPMDNPDLGTIVLHRIIPVEGQVVSVSELAAPKTARKAFDQGRQAVKANRAQEARQDFEKAAGIYPQYAAAWCELGKLCIERQQLQEARRLYETAIRADPKYLDSYLQLAALQAVARQWPQLAATTGAALRLNPHGYPQAYYLNALANFNLRNADAAEKSAREAERLDARHRFPESWLMLGRILDLRRQFVEAAAQLREYLRLAPRAPDAADIRTRLTQIEELSASAAPVQPN